MSIVSSKSQEIRLIAEGGAPGTEIFVIDGTFRLLKKGLDRIEVFLGPGLYKVKFKRGSLIHEENVNIFPGSEKEIRIEAPFLPFYTPAPLLGSSTSHEYHQEAASDESLNIHKKIGSGSQIFLFVRDVQEANPGDPSLGLSLHDARGRTLVDYQDIGTRDYIDDPGMASWMGCNVTLNPGSYRLRFRLKGQEPLEQTVFAAPDWQTQIFIIRTDSQSDAASANNEPDSLRAPKLRFSDASILMSRIGEGFPFAEESLQLTELARQSLVSERVILKPSTLESLLKQKLIDPMLGIFACHLLIPVIIEDENMETFGRQFKSVTQRRAAHVKKTLTRLKGAQGAPAEEMNEPGSLKDLLSNVVEALRFLVGEHPDVRALSLYLNPAFINAEDFKPFNIPPMLRRSWELIVQADGIESNIIPSGTLADLMGARIWGQGPWLIWKVPPAAQKKANPDESFNIMTILDKVTEKIDVKEAFNNIMNKGKLNSLEENLVNFAFKSPLTKANEEMTTIVGPLSDISQMSRELGIPISTGQRALGSLNNKLSKLFKV